jgi:hypothetical protein
MLRDLQETLAILELHETHVQLEIQELHAIHAPLEVIIDLSIDLTADQEVSIVLDLEVQCDHLEEATEVVEAVVAEEAEEDKKTLIKNYP